MKKIEKVTNYIIGGELNLRQDDKTVTEKVKLAGLVNTIYIEVVEDEHLKFLGEEKLKRMIRNQLIIISVLDKEFSEIVDTTELANL